MSGPSWKVARPKSQTWVVVPFMENDLQDRQGAVNLTAESGSQQALAAIT